MSEPLTTQQHATAVADNYSKWLANGPIDIQGARAYNTGDIVSDDNVRNGSVPKELVRAMPKKDAQAVVSN